MARSINKEVEENAVIDDEYVNVGPLPFDADKYKHPLNVIVNGTKYSVPRGQVVRVPKVVAEVINQSMAQDMHAAAVEAEMMKPQIINF